MTSGRPNPGHIRMAQRARIVSTAVARRHCAETKLFLVRFTVREPCTCSDVLRMRAGHVSPTASDSEKDDDKVKVEGDEVEGSYPAEVPVRFGEKSIGEATFTTAASATSPSWT